jgi:hypothetical protein
VGGGGGGGAGRLSLSASHALVFKALLPLRLHCHRVCCPRGPCPGVDLIKLFRLEFTDKRVNYKFVILALFSASKSNNFIHHCQPNIGLRLMMIFFQYVHTYCRIQTCLKALRPVF